MKASYITPRLIEEFGDFLKNGEKSINTRSKYIRDIKAFSDFIGKRELTREAVLEYKAELGRRHSPTGANSALAAVNGLLKFMGYPELCVKQFKIQRRVFCSEERELSKQEYLSLVRTAEKRKNKRLALIIQTVCGTGIRVSELEFITVEAAIKGRATVNCKGKARCIFIVPELCKRLLKYVRRLGIKSGPIFITRNGKPINRCNIWRDFRRNAFKTS